MAVDIKSGAQWAKWVGILKIIAGVFLLWLMASSDLPIAELSALEAVIEIAIGVTSIILGFKLLNPMRRKSTQFRALIIIYGVTLVIYLTAWVNAVSFGMRPTGYILPIFTVWALSKFLKGKRELKKIEGSKVAIANTSLKNYLIGAIQFRKIHAYYDQYCNKLYKNNPDVVTRFKSKSKLHKSVAFLSYGNFNLAFKRRKKIGYKGITIEQAFGEMSNIIKIILDTHFRDPTESKFIFHFYLYIVSKKKNISMKDAINLIKKYQSDVLKCIESTKKGIPIKGMELSESFDYQSRIMISYIAWSETYSELIGDFEISHREVMRLRSNALENLSLDDVKKMVIRNDFYDLNISPLGKGSQHAYELLNSELVIDHITGLTWQQGGSDKNMTFEEAQKYVQELNNKKYAAIAIGVCRPWRRRCPWWRIKTGPLREPKSLFNC